MSNIEYTSGELNLISGLLNYFNTNSKLFEKELISFSPIQIWSEGDPLGYIDNDSYLTEFRFFSGEHKDEL